jgi:EAL domain-containing protein (putative c-di-GMP-specific phosphodiesterase class I)
MGVEALVRWQHPKRGFLPPDHFIAAAEQTGLIGPLTRWVLDKALKQCAALHQGGMLISVAVNLSARNLHDKQLPTEIADLLSRAGVAPAYLVLEITDTAVMDDPKFALEILHQLDKMGVTLAIDDFGTGYSSLAYLSKLPVDEIKIDKSFVLDMMDDKQAAVIVRSTIDLGHNLGLKVVAEGVETQQVWDTLTQWGCDTAQGFYMSKPLPADQLMQWLKDSVWAQDKPPIQPSTPTSFTPFHRPLRHP